MVYGLRFGPWGLVFIVKGVGYASRVEVPCLGLGFGF
jgi:hypothetical protein